MPLKKSKKVKKYTIDQYNENSRKYKENFKLLRESVGTPEHDIYIKIEEKLAKKDREIGIALGKYIRISCHDGAKECSECSVVDCVIRASITKNNHPEYFNILEDAKVFANRCK